MLAASSFDSGEVVPAQSGGVPGVGSGAPTYHQDCAPDPRAPGGPGQAAETEPRRTAA